MALLTAYSWQSEVMARIGSRIGSDPACEAEIASAVKQVSFRVQTLWAMNQDQGDVRLQFLQTLMDAVKEMQGLLFGKVDFKLGSLQVWQKQLFDNLETIYRDALAEYEAWLKRMRSRRTGAIAKIRNVSPRMPVVPPVPPTGLDPAPQIIPPDPLDPKYAGDPLFPDNGFAEQPLIR